jgi:hypothetical protein
VTESQRPAGDAPAPNPDPTTQPVPPVTSPQVTAPSPEAAAPAMAAPAVPVTAAPAFAAPPVVASPTAAPLASVIAKPKTSTTGRGTTLLMGLAAAIAIGGIAFAAGRLTAPAAAASSGRGQFAGNGQFPGNGQLPGNGQGFAGRGDFGGISIKGTVSAVSPDSLTVKLASGAEVTIPLSGSTTYHTATTSSASAVTVGSEVSVTPGARTANPNATPAPNASGAPGFGRLSFGPATDVTVVAP